MTTITEKYIKFVDLDRKRLIVYAIEKFPKLKIGQEISLSNYGTPEVSYEIVDFGHEFAITMYTLVVIVKRP